MLKPQSLKMTDYLNYNEVIDFNVININQIATGLADGINNELELARKTYEFVRDKIAHSGDIRARVVTCSASEVLTHGHGICCAKSHLFAAILRKLGIPTGFCYQWLISDDNDQILVLHGLNAIYLKSIGKWIRLDARGNKEGVNAEFGIEVERLAWPVRAELGEIDDPIIYVWPKEEVIQALRSSKDRQEFKAKWIQAQKTGELSCSKLNLLLSGN